MLDAFHPDDEERIAGAGVVFEPTNPPRWVRKTWALDAESDPLPPGVD